MDITCPRCGEPFDMDELHFLAEDNETSFDVERKRFFEEGCGFTFGGRRCNSTGSLRADVSSALYELYGDDIDGIANDTEDFDYMGAFDD